MGRGWNHGVIGSRQSIAGIISVLKGQRPEASLVYPWNGESMEIVGQIWCMGTLGDWRTKFGFDQWLANRYKEYICRYIYIFSITDNRIYSIFGDKKRKNGTFLFSLHKTREGDIYKLKQTVLFQ